MPAVSADHVLALGNEQKTKLNLEIKDQDVALRELPSADDCATHLKLLDTFVALRRSVELLADEANIGAERGWHLYCKRAVSRFEKWAANTERRQQQQQQEQPPPPVDLLMAWHALMLHPKAYARFIELGGNLGLNGLDWTEVSKSVNADITLSRFLDFLEEDASTLACLAPESRQPTSGDGIFRLRNSAGTVVFSYDLSAAIDRQFDFSSKMSRYAWLRSPTAEATIAQSIERYCNFFQLIAAHPGTVMVPTLDIDLVWHTHQLSPSRYRHYSKKMTGRLIDHDDDISAARLQELSTDMQELWRDKFGTEYHACLCWTCEAGRARVGVEAVEDRLREEEARRRELLPMADLAFPRCADCGNHPASCCPPSDGAECGSGCGGGCGGGCGSGCGSCGAMK